MAWATCCSVFFPYSELVLGFTCNCDSKIPRCWSLSWHPLPEEMLHLENFAKLEVSSRAIAITEGNGAALKFELLWSCICRYICVRQMLVFSVVQQYFPTGRRCHEHGFITSKTIMIKREQAFSTMFKTNFIVVLSPADIGHVRPTSTSEVHWWFFSAVQSTLSL